MHTEVEQLKAQHDLRRIVEQDLGPAPRQGGGALLWRCPFHQEQRGYSLAVWADGFTCFGACQLHGDVFDWLQRMRHLSFEEAVQVLSHGAPEPAAKVQPRRTRSEEAPPPARWQAAARQVMDLAEEALWSTSGEPALRYLVGRGLQPGTIQAAHLGYLPGSPRQWRTIAGLSVPCGITIPWLTDGAEMLWAVKVRRAGGFPKYVQIKGSSSGGLYQADGLHSARAALFCEGEFDTLLALPGSGAAGRGGDGGQRQPIR